MTARLRSRSRGSWHNSEGSWGLDGRWKLHLHCGRSEGFHDTVSDNSVIVVQRNSSHELQVRIKEPQRNSQWRVHNAVVNSKDSFEVRFSNGPHSFFECRHRSTMIEYHFFNIGKPPAAMVWVRVPHDYEVEPPIHYDYEVCLREHTQDAIVRLSNNILVVTRLGRRILKNREISRAWYGVDEHRGIDCTQEVQQLVNGGSTVRAENGLVSYDPAPFTRKVLKIFFEVEVEEDGATGWRKGKVVEAKGRRQFAVCLVGDGEDASTFLETYHMKEHAKEWRWPGEREDAAELRGPQPECGAALLRTARKPRRSLRPRAPLCDGRAGREPAGELLREVPGADGRGGGVSPADRATSAPERRDAACALRDGLGQRRHSPASHWWPVPFDPPRNSGGSTSPPAPRSLHASAHRSAPGAGNSRDPWSSHAG